jgi:hypothetical protein
MRDKNLKIINPNYFICSPDFNENSKNNYLILICNNEISAGLTWNMHNSDK